MFVKLFVKLFLQVKKKKKKKTRTLIATKLNLPRGRNSLNEDDIISLELESLFRAVVTAAFFSHGKQQQQQNGISPRISVIQIKLTYFSQSPMSSKGDEVRTASTSKTHFWHILLYEKKMWTKRFTLTQCRPKRAYKCPVKREREKRFSFYDGEHFTVCIASCPKFHGFFLFSFTSLLLCGAYAMCILHNSAVRQVSFRVIVNKQTCETFNETKKYPLKTRLWRFFVILFRCLFRWDLKKGHRCCHFFP